jgi:hypothetical protein
MKRGRKITSIIGIGGGFLTGHESKVVTFEKLTLIVQYDSTDHFVQHPMF